MALKRRRCKSIVKRIAAGEGLAMETPNDGSGWQEMAGSSSKITRKQEEAIETLAVSELSEGHRQILIPARQTSVVTIAVIAGHALLELDVGEVGNQLREN